MLPVINPPAGGKLSAGRTFELAGTAAPGALLKLFDGGKLLGQATADANGNWKMSVPPLNAGEHTLTAITYGADGEVQASSKPLTVIVSEPEPAAATGPAVQPKIGWPPDGSAVVSARPLVAGQSFPRGVVRIYDGATLLGETIADANGYWSFRPSVALTAGEHVLTAVATSADGLTTAKAPPVTITVRSRAVTIPSWKPVAGAAPVVITPENGDTVHTVQPLFAGTAAPNSKVRLYDGDKVMGEAAVDADGRWTFRPTAPLAEGEHIIAVAPLNADGSEGAAKDTVTITIASGLGSAPGGPGIIVDSTPASSANSRPVLTGQAPAGATIRVYDGDQLLGEVKSGPDGHWYYAPAAPLTAGDHVLRFEVVGADGSTVASTETPITVAAGAPSVKPPQITTPSQGQAAPGDVLSGTAPAGSQVQIYDGNTLIGGTTAGANGKWRFRLPANLTAGAHDIHVVAVDQTGLPVSQSKAVAIVVAPPRTLPVTGAARRETETGPMRVVQKEILMDPDDDVNPFDDETEEAGAMRAGGLGDLLGGLLGGGAASGDMSAILGSLLGGAGGQGGGLDIGGLLGSLMGGADGQEGAPDISGLLQGLMGGAGGHEGAPDMAGLMGLLGGAGGQEGAPDMAGLMGLLGGAGGQEGAPDVSSLLQGLAGGGAGGQSQADLGDLLSGLLGGAAQ